MSQKRCVRSHIDHIGIALQSGHEGRFHQRCIEMVEFLAVGTVAGILTRKHLGALTRIVIITCGVVLKKCLRAVEMLINQVTTQLTHLRPQVIEPLTA